MCEKLNLWFELLMFFYMFSLARSVLFYLDITKTKVLINLSLQSFAIWPGLLIWFYVTFFKTIPLKYSKRAALKITENLLNLRSKLLIMKTLGFKIKSI